MVSAFIPTSREALASQPAFSTGAAAAVPGRSDSSARLGVDAGSRLYEFWNAIFEGDGGAAGDPPSSATPRDSLGDAVPDTGQISSHIAPGESVVLPTSTTPARPGGTDLTLARLQEPVVNIRTPGSNVRMAMLARNDVTEAPVASSESDPGQSARPVAVDSPLPEEQWTPPPRSNSSDSVSVSLQGAAVSIVVRDATISTQEAVDCAFETARQLTGQRSALSRLTLNGQTIYQQQAAAPHGPPALLFAC